MRKEFDKALKVVARPVLEKYGYTFDGKRKFIKKNKNGSECIIEYQVGIRSSQGIFTVNLIVGEKSERLNCIQSTWFSKLVNKVFGLYDPWWKDIFLPKDKWWEISPFQKEMDSIIRKNTIELEKYGIAWLEDDSHN